MPARLVIIGSGETSPTMVKLHRELLAAAPGVAAMLDTPFGFQVNADDLTDKIRGYFSESVGRDIDVARWRRRDEPATIRERALATMNRADWLFAGPGSPSYALRQWIDTPVPAALIDMIGRGGTAVVGSAAAVTLGEFSIPVYEIYKVGDEPRWDAGLDLLGALLGIRAAVIPHYDNREGGRHDTRFCYLGAQRLASMEDSLPAEVGVLGVDEHTAVVLDLDSRTATVHGAGGITLRHRDRQIVVPAGESLTIDDLASHVRGDGGSAVASPIATVAPSEVADARLASEAPSLKAVALAHQTAFDLLLGAGDAEGALGEALALEEQIHAWSADTLQGSELENARTILRGMLVALAGAAESGLRDEREVIAPYVEVALSLRARARADKDFATSDAVRDALAAAGIEVRDTPTGQEWDPVDG